LTDPADIPFADHGRAMLQRLAELGMVMAEKLAAEPEVTPETAMQFSRVAKAVRQTIALEHRLSQEAARAAAPDPISEGIDRIRVKRGRLFDGFKRKAGLAQFVAAAYEETYEKNSWERQELDGRLDAFSEPTLEDDLFLDRPAGEIIIEIMEGLGLVPHETEGFDYQAWKTAVMDRYAEFDADPAAGAPAWPVRAVPGATHQRPPDG
jgi:hypothetical protein